MLDEIAASLVQKLKLFFQEKRIFFSYALFSEYQTY